MNISFKSIELEGFQSIENALVDLSSQGVVLVKGINNYEGNASSNGSGKSSIFEGILYALYGRTSSGIIDPSNRYLNKGCLVKLDFSVDDRNYTVIRTIKNEKYGTKLILYRDLDDISGRNKTDTEKMIKNDILKIDMDVFLSTIFLSQGFSGKISSLTPSGRKERIETLTDTISLVDDFKNKLSSIKNKHTGNLNEYKRNKSYNEGLRDNISLQIDNIMKDIQLAGSDISDCNVNEVESKIEELDIKINTINNKINEVKNNIYMKDKELSRIKSDNYNSERNLDKYKKLILSMNSDKSKVCPTCGQEINNLKYNELLNEYSLEVSSLKKNIIDNNDKITDVENEISNLNNIVNKYNDGLNNFKSIKLELCDKLLEIKSYKNISRDKEKVVSLKENLVDINKKLLDIDKSISDEELMVEVSNHCLGLISKQFRGYILQEIINFMNSRLLDYSGYLFSESTEVIKLVVDSSKLDIYLGDVLYDTLSGGEKKKVDIALVLAQRDLALNIAGFSCNILILDEVMENLDETSTNCSLNLLMEASADIESMFIISHNNYSIQSDSIITIEKDNTRMSKISIS